MKLPKTLPLLLLIQLALLSSLSSQTSEQLRANLYSFDVNGTVSLNDGNLTTYNISNSNDIDGMDAIKMTNMSENFGLRRGATTLAIERRKRITSADTIFFTMWHMQRKNYRLDLFLKGLEHSDLTAVLEDEYLNTKTPLHLNGANSSIFTITDSAASYAPSRFRIIFSLASSFKVLPISFTGIKAFEKNNYIDVEWGVENEKDIVQYVIHTSLNGQQFSPAATISARGKSSSHYRWTDFSSVKGNNFYRISSIDLNGKATYSEVIKVFSGQQAYAVSVYPNPVVNGHVNVQIADQPKGVYTARLIDVYAQAVQVATLLHNGGSSTQTLQVNKNIKGNYVLEIITPGNRIISCKVLLQ